MNANAKEESCIKKRNRKFIERVSFSIKIQSYNIQLFLSPPENSKKKNIKIKREKS